MHFSLLPGGIGKIRLLFHRQGVNVAAQGLHRPFLFSLYYGHKPRFQLIGQDFYPCLRQDLPDLVCGSVFLVGQLRILVKPLKPFLQAFFQFIFFQHPNSPFYFLCPLL